MAQDTTTDKFGNEIQEGDTVEFVFGGDAFQASADAIAHMEGRDWLQVTITTFIPAAGCALTEKAKKSSAKSSSPPDTKTDDTPTATPSKATTAGGDHTTPKDTTTKADKAADAAANSVATKAATETGPDDQALEKPVKSSSTKGKK